MALVANVLRTHIAGDIVETGVYRGGTTIAILTILQDHNFPRRLWACDSFKGLPSPVDQDQDCTRSLDDGARSCKRGVAGAFASSRTLFHRNMRQFGVAHNAHHLRIVEGWYNETLPPRGLRHISLLRLDGDLFTSTMDALRALYPLVVRGGLVYVDDYGSFAGCSAAVDKYLAMQPEPRPTLHRIMEPMYDGPNGTLASHFEAVWFIKQV